MSPVRTEYVDGEGAASLRIVGRDLANLPKTVRRTLRPRLRKAGTETLRVASMNAAAWSSRIPHAMSLRVSFAKSSPGVTIVVDASKAPHARAFEGIVSNTFRHPVFARPGRDVPWVTQEARPYLRPAVDTTGRFVVEQVHEAVDDAMSSISFK